MKIGRFYLQLPPCKGGMEKHVYELTKFQSKKYKTYIFFVKGNNLNFLNTKCNIKCGFLKYIYLIKRPIFIRYIFFNLCVINKLLFHKQQFDVIHIHGDWSSLIFVKILKKLTKAKVVIFSLHDQLKNKFTHKKLLPKLVQNVDLIFATGYEAAKQLEKLSGKKVIVQPSGVNEIFFKEFDKKFDNDIFTIVTVANLLPKKNLDFVLDIAKECPSFQFVIIGDGPKRKSLNLRIKKEKINNVKLLGFKTPHEIREYYQKSDVFLLTSFEEGTPTSALEAITCGLAIVSSNAGGLCNIVKDNINGFVIKDFDKNKFVEKINFLYKNKELRKKIFENNKELSKNYSWEHVAYHITKLTELKLHEKT